MSKMAIQNATAVAIVNFFSQHKATVQGNLKAHCTLISHKNGAFRKRSSNRFQKQSSNRRNLKTLFLRFSVVVLRVFPDRGFLKHKSKKTAESFSRAVWTESIRVKPPFSN